MSYKFKPRELAPVSYRDVLAFFNHVGRTPSCPVCPHVGNWNFHVEGESFDSGNPVMVFMDIPQISPPNEEPSNVMRMIALECPQCGHLEFIQAAKILQYLKARDEQLRKGPNL